MANGRNTVITGPLPLVVPDGAGGRVPVDLSLADSGSALAPRHPLVPLRIATHLSDGIGLGPIAIHPPASAQTGSPMVVGQRAFFANSAADTDTVVVPLPTGVAVDWVLRSAASPESEMLSLSLPRGWRLAAPRSQHGGAIIVDQHSQPEVAIAPPAAHDADGMLVRAFYRVQGDNLVVEISHRNLDVKYPIEVDPNFGILSFGSYTGYPGPGNFDSWGCLQQGREWGIPGCSDGSNLVAGTNGSSQPFQVGDYDESVYKAPGSAFVFEAALGGIWSNVGSYNSFFGQTVMSMFYGVYNADGSLEGQSVFDPNNENYVSNQVCSTDTCAVQGNPGNEVIFGQVVGAAGTFTGDTFESELYAAELYMGDNAAPSTPTTNLPAPGTVDRIVASSTQGGLGLSSISVTFPTGGTGPGNSTLSYSVSCENEQPPWTMCPGQETVQFGQGLPNGTYQATITATSVGGVSSSTAQTVDFKADAATPNTGPITIVPAKETTGGRNPAMLGCVHCDLGEPVNTATGDYWESSNDLAIGGRGPGLQMTRTYSSLEAEGGQTSPLGPGWSMSYGMSMHYDSGSGGYAVVNPNGSQELFTPNGNGGYTAPTGVLATLVQNSDGTFSYTVRARSIYTFNGSLQLASVADLNGNKTTFSYNGSGQLVTAIDSSGRRFTFAYNGSGQLTSVTDSTGRSVSYSYDGSGNLATVTDVRGHQWHYTYDSNHLLLTVQDPIGNVVTTNTYDSQGRVLTQTDGVSHKTTFSYSSGGDPSQTSTQVIDPNGYTSEYDYSGGVLWQVTKAIGTPSAATSTYGRDQSTFAVTSVADPNGNASTATYDAQGNQTSTTDALGRTTSSTYDSLNDLTSHIDGNGVTTTYTYDSHGNLLTRSTPLVGSNPAQTQTTTYTYGDSSNPGLVTALKDPNGNTTTFAYDSAGNLTSRTDAAGDATTYTYDGLSRRLTMVSPRGNAKGSKPSQYTTGYSYDAAGDLLTKTDPLGHATGYSYDNDGNVLTVTDPDGNATSYTYNAANERTKVTRADGTSLQTGYDGDGNVTSQTDGAGHTTGYSYDALDHLSSMTDPLSRATSYGYDAVGNLISKTDPLSRTTTYGYDGDNELTSISYSDGQTPNVSYGYDKDGRRTSMTDGTGSWSYTYDSLGRLTKVVDGHGDAVSYGYDLANNPTNVTYPNGKTVTRTFDTAERLATITDWLGNKTTFAYDPDSDLASTTFPSSTTNVDGYTYNNADQLTAVSMAKGRSTLASLTYTRDNNGQVTGETPSGLPGTAQSYTYNKLNQLTQAGSKNYAYDQADNPTTLASKSGYAYDAANQITQAPSASYSYDQLGERTAVTPSGGSATNYSYDQAGRVTSLSGAATASYAYNGDGLRASKTVGGHTSYFTWDTTAGPPELLSDGSTGYVNGPGGVPLEQITSNGTVTYYHHDQLGSTRLLTNTSGSSVGTFSYDPYGNLTGSTGTTTTPFGYAGQYSDFESGLIYLQARYYEPATGQFLTRDPLDAQTLEAYVYTTDNPVNATDASGLADIGEPLNGLETIPGNANTSHLQIYTPTIQTPTILIDPVPDRLPLDERLTPCPPQSTILYAESEDNQQAGNHSPEGQQPPSGEQPTDEGTQPQEEEQSSLTDRASYYGNRILDAVDMESISNHFEEIVHLIMKIFGG